jgi:hypothetical protein
MSDRVVVFLDWQNVYMGAREAFCRPEAPSWHGQVDPVALAVHLADDSPFDRELTQVRIYRGIPDPKFEPKAYSACRRQVDSWERSELVHTTLRKLRYPSGRPRRLLGERPQEKGIDVALGLDFAMMAVRDEYDVGILMSTDADMKPALEAASKLSVRIDVASWGSGRRDDRCLSITGRNLYCHWVRREVYERVTDPTKYTIDSSKGATSASVAVR